MQHFFRIQVYFPISINLVLIVVKLMYYVKLLFFIIYWNDLLLNIIIIIYHYQFHYEFCFFEYYNCHPEMTTSILIRISQMSLNILRDGLPVSPGMSCQSCMMNTFQID